MSDFADLIARAIQPTMGRAEREQVYDLARGAVLRLQEREGRDPQDPLSRLQRHLVEETIRDVEMEVMRFIALEKMRLATQAQDAEHAALKAKRR